MKHSLPSRAGGAARHRTETTATLACSAQALSALGCSVLAGLALSCSVLGCSAPSLDDEHTASSTASWSGAGSNAGAASPHDSEPCRSLPQLQLVWPPEGHGATCGVGVWCAQDRLGTPQETFSIVLSIEESNRRAHDAEGRPIAARLVRGASPLGGGWERCVQLQLDEAVAAKTALLPPAILRSHDGRAVACIEQTPLRADAAPRPAETLSCDGEWQQAGLGCITTTGTLAYLQTPPQPLLWIVHKQHTALQRDIVAAIAWDTLAIDLPAVEQLDLTLETVDLGGHSTDHTLSLGLK